MGIETAAQRVGQQLLRHRADEDVGPAEQRLAQRHDAVDLGAVRQLARRVDRAARPRACARRRRRRSSRARSRSDPSPCGSSRRPDRRGAPPSARASCAASGLPRSPSAPARRRRRRRRRAEDVLENPFAAQDRRRPLGVRRDRQDAALPEQPFARLVGDRPRAGSGCRRRSGCRSAAPAAR